MWSSTRRSDGGWQKSGHKSRNGRKPNIDRLRAMNPENNGNDLLKASMFAPGMTSNDKMNLLEGSKVIVEFYSEEEDQTLQVAAPREMLLAFSRFARETLTGSRRNPMKSCYRDGIDSPKSAQYELLQLPETPIPARTLVYVLDYMKLACKTGDGAPLTPGDDFYQNIRILQIIQVLVLYYCQKTFEEWLKKYISKNKLTLDQVQYLCRECNINSIYFHMMSCIAYEDVHDRTMRRNHELNCILEWIRSHSDLKKDLEDKLAELGQ